MFTWLTIKNNLLKFLIWIDRMSNKYLLFGRWETISSRAGRDIESDKPHTVAIWLCRLLDIVDPDHCVKSARRNRIRRAMLEQSKTTAQKAKEMKK